MRNLLFFLLISFHFYGQKSDSLAWRSDLLTEERWPEATKPGLPFRFSACIEVASRLQHFGRTTHMHYYSEAQWLKQQSFLADSVAERYKPLAQLYFDCYELEARKIQEVINVENELNPEYVISAQQRAKKRIASLGSATNDGTDKQQFNYWRKWMDSTLSVTPRQDIPNWKENVFGIGLDGGAGVTAFGGGLAHYFKPLGGFTIGGTLRFGRVYADAHYMGAGTVSKLDVGAADFKFSDTNSLRIKQSSFSLGFRVFSQSGLSVIPYVSVSTFHVLNLDQPLGSLYRNGPVSFGAEGGVLTEWNFRPFYQDNQALSSLKLLFRIGVLKMNYLKEINGTALKMQLGIGYTLNAIRNIPFNE